MIIYLGRFKLEAAYERTNAPTHVNIMVQPAIFLLLLSFRISASNGADNST